MDGSRNDLDNPNMNRIPTYALFGDDGDIFGQDWLHWETIPARSRLHGFTIAPHRHGYLFQILSLTGGSGQVMLDGVAHQMAPQSVAIIPALTVHGYDFSRDVDGIVLTLTEREAAHAGIAIARPAVVLGEAAIQIHAVMADLIAESDRTAPARDIAMRARITLLMVALHRAMAITAPVDPRRDPARAHAEAFLRLVEDQFRQNRSVAGYARQLHVSQTHLGRICRELLGASPLGVIERRIALEARRLLLFSHLTVKEIGADLGYDDPAYFTRALTRLLGCAPVAFRARAAVSAAAPPPLSPPA